MKPQWKHTAIILFTALSALLYGSFLKESEETILFFPIDSSLKFEFIQTKLDAKQTGKEKYRLEWRIQSKLIEPAFLRQDASLLFKNGVLIGLEKDWKQNTKELNQIKVLKEKDSGLFKSISFHYAEIHPSKSEFTSVQEMTQDHLYVIRTPESSFQVFRDPILEDQYEWKMTLDRVNDSSALSGLSNALQAFHLEKENYDIVPLTELIVQQHKLLRTIPKAKQEEIIGKLWEGLYKNYVLGIKKEDGSSLSPLGSTIPYLLVSKDHKELLVLFTASDGSPIMLRQRLGSS